MKKTIIFIIVFLFVLMISCESIRNSPPQKTFSPYIDSDNDTIEEITENVLYNDPNDSTKYDTTKFDFSSFGSGEVPFRRMSDDAKREYLIENENYSSSVNDIIDGTVRTGWSPEMVIYSWGDPDDINSSGGIYGTTEQWIYERGRTSRQYLYFQNGKLTSWQSF